MSETYNNNNFCGVYRKYYDKDKTKIKLEVFMMNGKKEGVYKKYYDNGQLCEEVNYIDDKKV